MTEVVLLFAELATEDGHRGVGFSYSKRAGGPAQYAHAREVADRLLDEDPSDIGRLYERSGVATQAIAALTRPAGAGGVRAGLDRGAVRRLRRRGARPAGRRARHPDRDRRDADQRGRVDLAPHFAMQIHLHLAAVYPRETWVEHFEWLDPLFDEQLEIAGGRMLVPSRPGLGVTISEQARAWTADSVEFGKD